MDILSCSAAIGAVEPGAAKSDDTATMQARMLAYPVAQTLPQLSAAAQQAKAAGKLWALGGCEVVSAEQSFLGPERSLLRSQSAAVAVLDELLLALAGGSEAAQFSRFAQGSENATHVDAHGMSMHPSALAILLYNLHAGGMDLVTTSLAPPPQDGPAAGVPALAAHAFKGKDGYSVLLLNRSPSMAYSATIALPGTSSKARCYRIASAIRWRTTSTRSRSRPKSSTPTRPPGSRCPAQHRSRRNHGGGKMTKTNLTFILVLVFVLAGAAMAQDWPQWRGPDRRRRVARWHPAHRSDPGDGSAGAVGERANRRPQSSGRERQ